MKRMSDIKVGEIGSVVRIDISGSMKRRFTDIGLIENTVVECVGHSPHGDPKAFLIRGAVIAIRDSDSCFVMLDCT